MKKSMISELYCSIREYLGSIKMTEKEKELLTIAIDANDKIEDELTHRQKELFNNFVKARENEFAEEVQNAYVEAFKIGVLFGLDCTEI